MHRTTPFRYALVTVVGLGLAACSESPTPPTLDPALVRASEQRSPQGVGMPSDDELDRQIPGFGGFFFDRDGAPTVYLARGNGRGPAEQALGRALSARGLSVASMRVREAKFGWKQLQRWQNDATVGAFDVPGTVFVDNDETSNRIKIGVENTATAGQVRAAVARLGVADDAVIVERTQPIVQVAMMQSGSTLQNVTDRPVRAGVQINFPGFLCSVGFNATSNGQASFITASHCTSTQGGVESTPYWQPTQSASPGAIATEVADPAYSRNLPGCPKGRSCRYSDASRAAYANAANQGLGRIAATSGANNGSLTITGTILIGGNDCTLSSNQTPNGGCVTVGQTINKIGRTTGWTSGRLSAKCVNTGVQGSKIVQLCQNFVDAGVGGGDSGSDVFTGTSNVTLAGILWGGSSNGSQFVYSPFGNVVKELGPLTVK